MADEKKIIGLSGLDYYNRKLDAKKANLASPAFTGTPTINGVEIATKSDMSNKIGFVEIEDNILYFYSDDTKNILICSIELPTSNDGIGKITNSGITLTNLSEGTYTIKYESDGILPYLTVSEEEVE